MLITPLTRAKLVELLPESLEIAEIGVASGEFSRRILEGCKPRRLRMIDAWAHQDVAHLKPDSNNPEQAVQDSRHAQVLQDFAPEIASGRVVVERAFSHVAAERIADGSLDVVYIDADHSYDAVMRDLACYAPKVAPGGLVMGHDYTLHPRVEFGVVRAVNDFVLANGYTFLALTTGENFPSWAIAAGLQGTAGVFMERIASRVRNVVEVTGYPEDIAFEPKYVRHETKGVQFVPSFSAIRK
ncbi:class I SAM-dependent methyltransferase [Nisaea sp.]|uniref:class I SAM-dependent methyltransferase n=1 Tax=Nisaea sp. TaxID=2024842 RepID=UPI003B5218D5